MDIKQLRTTVAGWDMPVKIIFVNVIVFVALRLAVIVCMLCGAYDPQPEVVSMVELPSRLQALMMRPWTVVTYMFAQYDLLHLLFNMLWLYWFGAVMLYRTTPAQLLVLYVYGGLAGAAAFLGAYNLLPYFAGSSGLLSGSSASVLAIVTATAVMMPGFRLRLLFLGGVKLKWIALATIALVLIGIGGENMGGEMAHIGGIAAGAAFGWAHRRGVDLTRPVRMMFNPDFCRRRKPRRSPNADPDLDRESRESLDEILDKIRHSGYSSLTAPERRKLFDVSKRIK